MSAPQIEYDVVIETEKGAIVVDWGGSPNWADRYRVQLDGAKAIALVPKGPESLPVVRIELGLGKRWVIFSRVAGRVSGGLDTSGVLRLYCVGWQATIKGVNVKSLIWIYPDGVIENANEPSMLQPYLALEEKKRRDKK